MAGLHRRVLACGVGALAMTLLSAAHAGELGAAPSESAPADSATDPGAPPEEAGPEDVGVTRAREAFRLGSALAKQGQWNEALAAFERSESERSHPVTQFNIGYVERALGHLTRARKWFKAALGSPDAGGMPPQIQSEAQSYLAEIERKVARLVVTTEPDTAVAFDGRPLESEGTAERPVLVAGTAEPGAGAVPPALRFDLIADPGAHVIVLSRAGLPDTVVNEQVSPGESRALALRMHTPEPAPPPAAPSPVAAPPPEEDEAPSSSNAAYMWTAYGIGAAGFVAGGVFGVLALGEKSTLDDEAQCGTDKNQCLPGYEDEIDAMNNYALFADLGFLVGVLGAGVGTYFLLTEPSDPAQEADHGLAVSAAVGPGSVMIRGTY